MGWVWELELPLNEQAVMLALADHAEHDGTNVRPGNGLVAWKIGCSIDTVRRVKKQLEAKGVLVLVATPTGRPRIYRIDMTKGQRKPPYRPEESEAEPLANCHPLQIATPCTAMPPPPLHSYATPPLAQLCKGNHQDPSIKPSSPAPAAAEPKASAHTVFVKAWGDAYLEAFGDPYLFAGGKDGSAVKRLLKAGLTTEELLVIARAAWGRGHLFNCKQAASIAGFASRLNDIRAEIRGVKTISVTSDLAGWEEEVNGTKS